jgi:hypothetical protein
VLWRLPATTGKAATKCRCRCRLHASPLEASESLTIVVQACTGAAAYTADNCRLCYFQPVCQHQANKHQATLLNRNIVVYHAHHCLCCVLVVLHHLHCHLPTIPPAGPQKQHTKLSKEPVNGGPSAKQTQKDDAGAQSTCDASRCNGGVIHESGPLQLCHSE